jgi:hypothetical protein
VECVGAEIVAAKTSNISGPTTSHIDKAPRQRMCFITHPSRRFGAVRVSAGVVFRCVIVSAPSRRPNPAWSAARLISDMASSTSLSRSRRARHRLNPAPSSPHLTVSSQLAQHEHPTKRLLEPTQLGSSWSYY